MSRIRPCGIYDIQIGMIDPATAILTQEALARIQTLLAGPRRGRTGDIRTARWRKEMVWRLERSAGTFIPYRTTSGQEPSMHKRASDLPSIQPSLNRSYKINIKHLRVVAGGQTNYCVDTTVPPCDNLWL